jgi:hypothetical protein
MSDTPPNTGPSHETLKALAGMLPSLKQGLKDGSVCGKGKVSHPTAMCKICSKMWDFVRAPAGSDLPMIRGENCADCSRRLKAGMVAICNGANYAFVESKGALADERGNVIKVSDATWRAMEKEFSDAQMQKEKTANDSNENN